jgi:hypothetical protein
VRITVYVPLFQQMRQRMESEEGKQSYLERYKIEHKTLAAAAGRHHH